MSLIDGIRKLASNLFKLQSQVGNNSDEIQYVRQDIDRLTENLLELKYEIKNETSRREDREKLLDQEFDALKAELEKTVQLIRSEIEHEKERREDKETILFQRLECLSKDIENKGKYVENKLLEHKLLSLQESQFEKQKTLQESQSEKQKNPLNM